jgi:hypothetical protein
LLTSSRRLAAQDHSHLAQPVYAMRELTLKPDADVAEFERFIREVYAPTVAAQVPGMRAYVIKGDRGEKKGRYILFWEISSAGVRDLYFPPGEEQASPALQQFLKTLPRWEMDRWVQTRGPHTDYVVIR